MENNDIMIVVGFECIIRDGAALTWCGPPADPMAKALERHIEGKASEVDMLALSAFPVIDAPTDAPSLFVEYI